MQTALRDRHRRTEVVGHRGVQVVDLAQAVAAELERVGQPADQVLTVVEVVLPVARRARIAVRHNHLRHRGPVDDRPLTTVVVVADLVQRQALTGVEPDPHRPVLPADRVAVDGEARPLGLGDLDRLEALAQRPAHRRVVVVARCRRHRQVLLVDQLEDDALDQVDVGRDAVDRVRPGQVGVVLLHEGQHPHHPPADLVLEAVAAGGQRAGPELADVGQPAPGHRGPPALVGVHDLLGPREVLHQDRQRAVLLVVEHPPRDDRAFGQRDHHVARLAGGDVDQHRPQRPLRHVAGLEGQHLGLRRLLEPVVGEPHVLTQQPGRGQDLTTGEELLAGRRVERVRDPGGQADRGSAHLVNLPLR